MNKSIDKMINYARNQKGRVGYSMNYPARLGPYYMDCSSFVYKSLMAGGFISKNTPIGNTETLYKLNGSVFEEIFSYADLRRGDIFIRGKEGYSAGAGGHTGIFLSQDSIIHCNAKYNGVSENMASDFLDRKRSDTERYFRPKGARDNPNSKRTKGSALVLATTNVRAYPSISSPIVAYYTPGQRINYDMLTSNEGYYRLSYIGSQSGKRRYVAYGDYSGNRRIDIGQ